MTSAVSALIDLAMDAEAFGRVLVAAGPNRPVPPDSPDEPEPQPEPDYIFVVPA